MIKLPKEVDKVIDKLNHMGFQTFVVGGSLRDRLMGFQPVDWDLATRAKDLLVQAFPAGQFVLGDNLKTLQAGTVVQLQEGKARGIAAGPEPAGNPEILFLGG